MNNYIFLTDEDYTYQPNSESDVPNIVEKSPRGCKQIVNTICFI